MNAIAQIYDTLMQLDPETREYVPRVAESLTARGVEVLGYGRGTHAALAPTVRNVATMTSWQPRGGGVMRELRTAGLAVAVFVLLATGFIPGTRPAAVVALMIMHVVVLACAVPAYALLSPVPARP